LGGKIINLRTRDILSRVEIAYAVWQNIGTDKGGRGYPMTENDISEDLFEQELSLLLLYLASWTEGKSLVPRAWKNHRFEILRALTGKGFLFDSKGAKSVHLTAEGVAAAKKLEEKYRRRG